MKKNRLIVPTILIALVVLFIAIVAINRVQKANAYGDLPNYTDVKKPIEITALNYEKQPYLGNAQAKVKVVEFADFKCPACKNWKAKNMDTLKKEFIDTGKAQFFFVNYAFLDRDSYMAAAAGEAIAKQSNEKFWEFYSKLYDNQGKENEIWATKKFLLSFVKDNIKGIDFAQFQKDMQDNAYLYDVKEDFKIAGSLGVNGTPKFMVNGKLLPTSSYEELKAAIEQELAK